MAFATGQVIKGYELREAIGEGGFGAVFRAYQSLVQREVAIKIILPEFANKPDFVRGFEREAQLVARLEHLHIVPLYDYWREPDGAYLIMRWLRGGSLANSLKTDGPWEIDAAARLLDQIASALTTAHRGNVVHRDIKPANILLDEEHNAYLTDFGIAKTLGHDEEEEGGLAGSPYYLSPEQITGDSVSAQTDIYGLGIVLYELLTGMRPFNADTFSQLLMQHISEMVPPLREFRTGLPLELDAVVQRATAKKPEDRFPDALEMARAFRQAAGMINPGVGSTQVSVIGEVSEGFQDYLATLNFPLSQIVNPYKGLRPFEEADSSDFFGREVLIERLLNRLREQTPDVRFLAVVGPSGSGKSSVVKAGLLPKLREGVLPGSGDWFIADMVPGNDPLSQLLSALLSVAVNVPENLGTWLRENEGGLPELIRYIMPAGSEVVLVIDQFEEVFTRSEHEADRLMFLRSLYDAALESDSNLRIIITLRADFYDRPLLYPAFGELMRQRTEVVLPLSAEELGSVIVSPAERIGLTVEPELVAAIIAEVSEEPGALPLLQYALTELFERREGLALRLKAYRESGGILGALARRAEELYTKLDEARQGLVRQLFLRLVTPGEGTDDTRRRIRWAEMLAIKDENALIQGILDVFGKYRLLTFDNDPQTREPTIEVAHEAMIRQWQRLREWIDESREELRLERRLSAATEEWQKQKRDSSFLATGVRLQQFEGLVDTGSIALGENERAFVRDSVAQREAKIVEEEVRRAHEAMLERRDRRRLQVLVGIFVTAAIVAGGLALVGFNQRQGERDAQQDAEFSAATAVSERDRADLQADVSRSRELSARALANLNTGALDLTFLLMREAFQVKDDFETRSGLLSSLQQSPHLKAFLHGHSKLNPVRDLVYSPDGTQIAAVDGTVIFRWDASTKVPSSEPLSGHTGDIWSLAYSPDGKLLASGDSDGIIRLWDVDTGEVAGEPLEGHGGAVNSLVFNADASLLVSGGEDSLLYVWDVARGEITGEPLSAHADTIYDLAFSLDGALLASASADGTVILWDVDGNTFTPRDKVLEGHTNWVLSLAFRPDGGILASGSADNRINLWDVETGELLLPLTGHDNWVRDIAYSPDGAFLVSASDDGTLRLWNAKSGAVIGLPLNGHIDKVLAVDFASDSQTIISGGEDGQMLMWDAATSYPLGKQIGKHDAEAWSIAFSPVDDVLLSTGADNRLRLWDAVTGEASGESVSVENYAVASAFSPDGRVVMTGHQDGSVMFWSVSGDSFTPVAEPVRRHSQSIFSVAFSSDGRLAASGSDDGIIQLWEVESGEASGDALEGHQSGVQALAFSPQPETSNLLVSASRDAEILFWDVESRGVSLILPHEHQGEITGLAFSPNGDVLASSSRDGTVILWDVENGESIQTLQGHTNWVLSLAFSPDGRMLASGTADRTVHLWSMETLQPLGEVFRGYPDWITGLDFNRDSNKLAIAALDGSIILTDVSIDSWLERVCTIANRNFSSEEWVRFFPGEIYRATCVDIE